MFVPSLSWQTSGFHKTMTLTQTALFHTGADEAMLVRGGGRVDQNPSLLRELNHCRPMQPPSRQHHVITFRLIAQDPI
jgi:hypothetical protein